MDPILSLILQTLLLATIFALVTFLLIQALFSFVKPESPRLSTLSAKRSTLLHDRWPQLQEQEDSTWKRTIQWSGLPLVLSKKILLTLLILLIASLMFGAANLAGAFASMLACLTGFILWKANGRRKKFAQQLPDALDAFTQSLRAGYALPHALELVERETREPASVVFGALARAEEYRLDFGKAAQMVEGQLKLPEWTLVAEALRIQHRVGGNLIPVLAKIAGGLRDRLRVEQEIQTATASGKFSGIIISALAPLSFLMFYLLSPNYVTILLESPLGLALLSTAAILEVIGFLLIWQIVSLDY